MKAVEWKTTSTQFGVQYSWMFYPGGLLKYATTQRKCKKCLISK